MPSNSEYFESVGRMDILSTLSKRITNLERTVGKMCVRMKNMVLPKNSDYLDETLKYIQVMLEVDIGRKDVVSYLYKGTNVDGSINSLIVLNSVDSYDRLLSKSTMQNITRRNKEEKTRVGLFAEVSEEDRLIQSMGYHLGQMIREKMMRNKEEVQNLRVVSTPKQVLIIQKERISWDQAMLKYGISKEEYIKVLKDRLPKKTDGRRGKRGKETAGIQGDKEVAAKKGRNDEP